MVVRTVVWGENVHEQKSAVVRSIYPDGMHTCIAGALAADSTIEVTTATLQGARTCLSAERLARTDVLIWWGHAAHGTFPMRWWNGSATPSGAAWA